ncbi:MAG: hypothetical protein MI741_03285 [Rhodospirillales bacterium]|nr:hypothetical protein [Rhodospirillales bacterium]
MAELTTLARPYAKAAFEVALKDKALDDWSSMLTLAASLTALLFEDPLPLVVGFVAMAIVFRLIASRQGKAKFNHAALVSLVSAAAVFVLAHFVTTQREQLIDNTRRLVDATVDPANVPVMQMLIAPDARLTGENGREIAEASRFVAELPRVFERFTVESQKITKLDAETPSNTLGGSVFSVTTYFAGDFGGPHRTKWQMRWQKGTDGIWRVVEVRWMSYNNQSPPTNLLGY